MYKKDMIIRQKNSNTRHIKYCSIIKMWYLWMARLTPRAYPAYSRLCETWVVCVSYYGL